MTSNEILAKAKALATPQRSKDRTSELINGAISDGQLSSKDIDELYGKKQISLDNIFGMAAQNRASLEGEVRSRHHVNVNDDGSWSWTPNQANYAPLYHPDGGDGSWGGVDPISPGQGTGWVRTGETKGKYDRDAQATYTYYGTPGYLNEPKEKEVAASTPETPAVAPANTEEPKKSFNIGDYMTRVNTSVSSTAEPEEFKADIAPTMYDDWVKRQPVGSPIGQSSSAGSGASASSTRRRDEDRADDGSYRFAASRRFRDDLNSRLGVG